MKPAALRHLLLVTGRAIAGVVPAERCVIDEVCETLMVGGGRRDGFRLEFRVGGETRELLVDSGRFAFYRRGDVPAQNATRPSDLDLRTQNWRQAHVTWAEMLGRPDIAELRTTRSIMPFVHEDGSGSAPVVAAVSVLGAATIIGALARRRWTTGAAGLAAVALTYAAGGRERRYAGLAGAVTTAGLWASPPSWRFVAGTVGISLSAAELPIGSPVRDGAQLAGAMLAGLTGNGAAGAVIVGSVADGIGGVVTDDRRRLVSSALSLGIAALGATVGSRSQDRSGAPPAVFAGALAAGLVADTVARSLEGTRTRLAPLVVPLGLAAASVSRKERRLAMSIGSGSLAMAATRRLTEARVRRSQVTRPTHEAPIRPTTTDTPVTLIRRNGDPARMP